VSIHRIFAECRIAGASLALRAVSMRSDRRPGQTPGCGENLENPKLTQSVKLRGSQVHYKGLRPLMARRLAKSQLGRTRCPAA
jgi:hypothetical protein